MFTTNDLIDAIFEALGRAAVSGTEAASSAAPAGLKKSARSRFSTPAPGRLFLSEFEIRGRLTSGVRELRIPKGAIVSPLAQDWLSLKGIRVVEE